LLLHAVGGFGFFIFTAELVGPAAKPPTAFSTIQGTFRSRLAQRHSPAFVLILVPVLEPTA
jgi:hypothetical protein